MKRYSTPDDLVHPVFDASVLLLDANTNRYERANHRQSGDAPYRQLQFYLKIWYREFRLLASFVGGVN
jgi:hypothetical protein